MDLDSSRAYVLGRDFRRGGALTLHPVDPALPAQALAWGEFVPPEPIVLRLQERRLLGDFASTGYPGLYAISGTVLELLRDGGFSGWTTFPIRVDGLMTEKFDGYRGLAVTGRAGEIDDSRSQRIVLPGPTGRPSPHRLGIHLRAGSWDGSDLFVPAGTGMVCATQPVRDALVGMRAVGIELTRFTEYTEWIWDE